MTDKATIWTATFNEADYFIGGTIGRFAQVLETETCRSIREKLKVAGAIERMEVIKAAEAGDRDSDYAMRDLAIEYLSRRESMPLEVIDFAMKALLRSLFPDPDDIEDEVISYLPTAKANDGHR